MAKIAVIPGDGAGIEVTRRGREGARAPEGEARSWTSRWEHFDFGAERYLKTGVALPAGAAGRSSASDYDAILFGAIGDPRVKDSVHAREILLGLRFGLDLYVNFRPCKLLDDRLSPLKGKGQEGARLRRVPREHRGHVQRASAATSRRARPTRSRVSEEINTRKGVERIIRAAFDVGEAARQEARGDGRQGERHPRARAVAAHLRARWRRSTPASPPRPGTSTRWRCSWCSSPRTSTSSSPPTSSATSSPTWARRSPAAWAWRRRRT